MALNSAGINALMASGDGAVIYAAIGSGPLAANQTSNEVTLLTLGAASGGVITVSNTPLSYTAAASAGATHVLFFDSAVKTTFYGSQALTGDQAFNAAGDYQVTALTITGSST